jgi:serine/threonine protein kinase
MADSFGNDLILLERLAAGGMAEVYRGKQLGYAGFEKTIAIKRILPNYAANEEFKAMFREEANLSGLLQHQNIVQIFGNGEFNDYLYLTMEFVDGKNVRQVLARADKKKIRIPVEFGLYIVSEAAKGLDYAHNFHDEKSGEPLEIVHRDMSPQNIMLSYDGAVKIVDFGIAKAAARSGQTKAGVLKGKFGYMSPEQAQGMPLDRRTDVFALGIILFELLTQRRLFTSDDDLRTLQLVKDCRVPRPSKYNPDVSQSLDAIVLKALKKEKSERYANGNELYVDLIRYLNQKYSRFLPTDLSKFLREVFAEDMIEEKKKREKANAEMPARQEISRSVAVQAPGFPLAAPPASKVGELTVSTGVTNPTESVDPIQTNAAHEAKNNSSQLFEGLNQHTADEITNKLAADYDATKLYDKESELNVKTGSSSISAEDSIPFPKRPLPPVTSLPPPRSSTDSGTFRKQLQLKAHLQKKAPPKQAGLRKPHPAALLAVFVLLGVGFYKTLRTEDNPLDVGKHPANECPINQTWNSEKMICSEVVNGVSPDLAPKTINPSPRLKCSVEEVLHPKTGKCVKGASLCRGPQKWDSATQACVAPPAADNSIWVLNSENYVPSGVLNLRSTPQADFVSINGKQVVSSDRKPLKSPIRAIRLKPGVYRIKVKNNFFGMSKEENITIDADRILDIDLLMK